jgi:hypothetical protein
MDKNIAEFLRLNVSTLRSGKLEDLYDSFVSLYKPNFRVSDLTAAFYEMQINPLLYMKDMPNEFASNLDIDYVAIPNTITSIGNGCFIYSKIESLYVPSSIRFIGAQICAGCSELTEAVFNTDNIKILSSESFFDCTKLSRIVFPRGLTAIADGAFGNCASLNMVDIPEGVAAIQSGAFYQCDELKFVTLPKTIQHIGNEVFDACDKLSFIKFNGTKEEFTKTDMAKHHDWLLGSSIRKAKCTDGDIDLQ